MRIAVLLLLSALLPISAHADSTQPPPPSGTITVTRTAGGKGCDIVLSSEAMKQVSVDLLWLMIDGKSEGFGGDYFNSFSAKKPIRYVGNVSDDLDGNVKDILEGQGLPVKANITTYLVTFGVNSPDSGHISETLHFRHKSNILAYAQFPDYETYKIGDKIPIFGVIALDESLTMRHVLGPHGEVLPPFAHLPNDLLHRITIQVQFVPKTTP